MVIVGRLCRRPSASSASSPLATNLCWSIDDDDITAATSAWRGFLPVDGPPARPLAVTTAPARAEARDGASAGPWRARDPARTRDKRANGVDEASVSSTTSSVVRTDHDSSPLETSSTPTGCASFPSSLRPRTHVSCQVGTVCAAPGHRFLRTHTYIFTVWKALFAIKWLHHKRKVTSSSINTTSASAYYMTFKLLLPAGIYGVQFYLKLCSSYGNFAVVKADFYN